MKGLSTQSEEKLSGERSVRRGISLCFGILKAYSASGTCAQKNGRWSTSENKLEQSTLGSLVEAWERYVDRQVPCHWNELGGDLPLLSLLLNLVDLRDYHSLYKQCSP